MVAEGELAVPSKVSVQAGHIPRGAVVSCFAFAFSVFLPVLRMCDMVSAGVFYQQISYVCCC